MKDTIPCPRCKGTGKISGVAVSVKQGKLIDREFNMNCPDCRGTGKLTKQRRVILNLKRKATVSFWCICGNPSGDTDFYDDVRLPDGTLDKHHWNCKDCGKVLQIG